jgi:carboxypeptidase T
LTGSVRAADTLLPISGALVEAGPYRVQTDVDGTYRLPLPAGVYTSKASANGFAPKTISAFTAAPPAANTQDFLLSSVCDVLNDRAEGVSTPFTMTTPWAVTGLRFVSPSHSFTDSPSGNYASNANVSMTSPAINLSGATNAELRFQSWCDTEAGADFGRVEISTDGGSNWNEVWRCSGTPAWSAISLPLPTLEGVSNAKLRFRLSSDASGVADGWYVDDISLRAAIPECRSTGALLVDGFE